MKNFQKEKAVPGLNRNGSNSLAKQSGRFAKHFHFKQKTAKNQCKNAECRSDDLRFAQFGYCLPCQEKAEFIVREKPGLIQKIRFVRELVLGGAI